MLDITDHNRLHTNRFGIGGNHPPSLIDLAKEAMTALGIFLKDHPVITTEEDARAAKLMKDRADGTIKDMEDERDGLVRPLNTQVAEINGRYRAVREPFSKAVGELRSRMTVFAKAEEAKRQAIAEAAAHAAAEAERIAREAEAAERETIDNASQGDLDADVVSATIAADAAFAEFERAGRAAERAARETHVKIGGGISNSASLRRHEVLTITDWKAAIEEIGLTAALTEAILTAARAYRKANGELPDGITATHERTM